MTGANRGEMPRLSVHNTVLLIVLTTAVFLRTWLLLGNGTQPYFLRRSPLVSLVLPVATAQLLIALIAILLIVACVRIRMLSATRDRFVVLGFFTAYAYALVGGIRYLQVTTPPVVVPKSVHVVIASVFVVALAVSLSRPKRAIPVLRQVTLTLAPVVAFILLRALWFASVPSPAAYNDGDPGLKRTSAPAARRAVVIIFDEMSQQVAFSERPAGVQLPNLDALRSQSIYATAAYAPSYLTSMSLPAITTGSPVSTVRFTGTMHAHLTFLNAPPVEWSNAETMFDDARVFGGNIGIVGWYHPYARILASKATDVSWYPAQFSIESTPGTESAVFPEALATTLIRRVLSFPLLGTYLRRADDRWVRNERVRCTEFVFHRGMELIRDPSFSLVFMHMPVPHPPPVYDRGHGNYKTTGTSSYIDNLALVDRLVGDLLQMLRSTGLDKNTSLIVTADHSWRVRLWRTGENWTPEEDRIAGHIDDLSVPFLISLPGHQEGVTYDRRVNVIATRGLVKRLLSGEISRPGQVADYLSSFNSPPPVAKR